MKKYTEKCREENIRLIAADRGLEFFLDCRIMPDVVIGDFDSLSEDGKEFLEISDRNKADSEIPYGGMTNWKIQKEFEKKPKDIDVIRLRPEKDDSDTQSAMNYAIRTGAKEIVILGVAQKQMASVTLLDRYNYMKLIPSGTVLKKSEQFGKYVSFFSLGGEVTGLTLEGFKYSLNEYHLTAADSGLTVSNEISSEIAKVTYESGSLLMIMSRD